MEPHMEARGVAQLRIVLTVANLDQALRLYRDGLGLPVVAEWSAPEGRGVLLRAGDATLELLDRGHAALIDRIEAGGHVAGPIRLAFAVPDVVSATAAACAAGARMVSEPVRTPWGDRNVRLAAPEGPRITLFQPPTDAAATRE
jgi:catechol 2,3-dioxygenase-like lactoylglutathione lyase family enzyme